jgi:hypothetical protein
MLDTYFLLFGRNGYWFFLEAFWDLRTGEEMGCETTWRKIFFQTLPQADPAAWRGHNHKIRVTLRDLRSE